jgi:hypothetical protein
MSSAILVRKISPRLKKDLEVSAKKSKRSMNDEVLWRLEHNVKHTPLPLEEIKKMRKRNGSLAISSDTLNEWKSDGRL